MQQSNLIQMLDYTIPVMKTGTGSFMHLLLIRKKLVKENVYHELTGGNAETFREIVYKNLYKNLLQNVVINNKKKKTVRLFCGKTQGQLEQLNKDF